MLSPTIPAIVVCRHRLVPEAAPADSRVDGFGVGGDGGEDGAVVVVVVAITRRRAGSRHHVARVGKTADGVAQRGAGVGGAVEDKDVAEPVEEFGYVGGGGFGWDWHGDGGCG